MPAQQKAKKWISKAKVLLYDIETSYIIGGTWGFYQTDVVHVIEDSQILCFAYKWLGDRKIHVVAQDDFKDYRNKNDDTNVVKALWELFNEADIVVAHNGISFDQKKARARFMVRGLEPPLPSHEIDTKRAMKAVAAHTSNKLDELNRSLGLARKIDTGGIETWTGCMHGDKKAWKRMKKYNKNDIIALEELYLFERPWIKNHPNVNVLEDRPDACPKCGLGPVYAGKKYRATNSNKFQYYRCQNCFANFKRRLSEDITKPIYSN